MVQDRFWKAATSCLFILLFSISPGEGTGYASSNYQSVIVWGSLGSANGQFNNPMGVAVDSSGYVYVADTGNNRVQKFTSTGTFVTAWGGVGFAIGVAVDSSGYVYVADGLSNGRVQKFTSTGTFVTAFGGSLNFLSAVAVDSSGYVYVANVSGYAYRGFIQKFTSTGTFVTAWGEGRFSWPYGLAVDSSGYVYVADYRIQKFTSTGTFGGAWGSAGSANGQFSSPLSVAVDSSGYVYVADSGNNRIQVQISYPDIFWQHQPTGSLSAWLMNGTSLAALATVTPGIVSDTNWKIAGVGDFNNDGQPDLLWQHQATGGLSAWLMNGTTLETLATVTPGVVSDTNWKIVGIGDFNSDGKPDLLWQHQPTGSLSAWLMNGTTLAALATVTPGIVSDTNWKIAGIW